MAGFLANRTQADGDYVGKLETFAVITAVDVIAPGDPVIIQGTGDSEGRSSVERATAEATRITGIVASVAPQFVGENLSGTGLAIGASGNVNVSMSPMTIFEVDVLDGSGAASFLNTAAVNANAEMDLTNDSTNPNGLTVSGSALSNTPAPDATVTRPFRIVGLTDPDPDTPTNFRKALVRINASTIADGALGVA